MQRSPFRLSDHVISYSCGKRHHHQHATTFLLHRGQSSEAADLVHLSYVKIDEKYIAAAAQNNSDDKDCNRGGGEGGRGKWWEPIIPDRSGHDNNGCGINLGHNDKDNNRSGGLSLSEGEEIKN